MKTTAAHKFQNALRIMVSLDEVSDVIGNELAAEFHRAPLEFAIRMDEQTWAKVFTLIERRM